MNVVINADKTKTSALRYAWSDSDSMPTAGWLAASTAELSSAKGAQGLPFSIRKDPGSGRNNGR